MPRLQPNIPKYFLYGESLRDVDERFLHVESIAERSRLHDWEIRPHAHRELNHLVLVTAGSGVVMGDDTAQTFSRTALIRVPAAHVHGFRFEPDTDGWVVTVSAALLGRITRENPELAPVFGGLAVVPLRGRSADQSELRRLFEALVGEFYGSAAARRAAIECRLMAILVAALRLSPPDSSQDALAHGSDSTLVSGFLKLIEAHYRLPISIAALAERLHVSQERLRLACTRVSGAPPVTLFNERRLLEAKRSLLYTNMTIQQVAENCGFDDPAYFSRFFTDRTGKSPKSFRAAHSSG